MYKMVAFITFCSISIFSYAQEKKASLGIGFGGSIVSMKYANESKGKGPGINYYLNGMYKLGERISVGFEYNGTSFYNNENTSELERANGFFAKGKYSLKESGPKPFLGISAGATGYNNGYGNQFAFGLAPEFGVQFKSFQISTLLHITGQYKPMSSVFNSTALIENLVIWQLNVGWNIGIGKG